MLTKRILLERVEKWLSPVYWSDINIHSAMYNYRHRISSIKVHEPDGLERPKFDDIVKLYHEHQSKFFETHTGAEFGPSWSTKWFRIGIPIEEVCDIIGNGNVAIQWDSDSEAQLYDNKGRRVGAFTGGGGSNRRDLAILCEQNFDEESGSIIFWVEMACNEMFGNGNNGMIMAPNDKKMFTLKQVDLVCINMNAYALYWDVIVLYDLVSSENQQEDMFKPEAATALGVVTQILNFVDLSDNSSILTAHSIAERFFSSIQNGTMLDHDVYAFGHCHIDTAWLWPYIETRRKVARSWSTQLNLLDRYESWQFLASQTVQFEWLKEDCPDLFRSIQKSVLSEKKRFVPIGGTYVEFDANLPSGESMIRQFLYGHEFLKKEFAMDSVSVFWLPDTFGYSAQLPQIMKGFSISYFLSQKLSWNLINKFPHNSFVWEGIDGSSVIAHFPPADNYNSEANVSDLLKTVFNNKSKMSSNKSMLLFGHGDGGGGPAPSHLEQLNRLHSCPGLPRIHLDKSPVDFFDHLASDLSRSHDNKGYPPASVWRGELYLELHQGSLTSQSKIKFQNRQCENLLRGLDVLSVYSELLLENDSYRQDISMLWKDVLLNQFHDVIPGTSISAVYDDSDMMLNGVLKKGRQLLAEMSKHLLLSIIPPSNKKIRIDNTQVERGSRWLFNACATTRHISVDTCMDSIASPGFSFLNIDTSIVLGSLYAHPMSRVEGELSLVNVDSGDVILENSCLRATFSKEGGLISLVDKRCGRSRELIDNSEGSFGNNLMLYDDVPFYWDAWDTMPYHMMTGRSLNNKLKLHSTCSFVSSNRNEDACSATFQILVSRDQNALEETNPTKLQFTASLMRSSPLLHFKLHVDWHEKHKMLKVEFPLSIRSMKAKYEMQFGLIERPTHINNSTDAAMFESCGHRFADLSETGYGCSLLNDCKYGYSCSDSKLCLTLLRSPKSPDPDCDMGEHAIQYAILPHRESLENVSAGVEVLKYASLLNSPMPFVDLESPRPLQMEHEWWKQKTLLQGLFWLVEDEKPGSLILDTIKLAHCYVEEGKKRSLIVRLYEALGGRGLARLATCCPMFSNAYKCNLNETYDPSMKLQAQRNENSDKDLQGKRDVQRLDLGLSYFEFPYAPFEIISIRLFF